MIAPDEIAMMAVRKRILHVLDLYQLSMAEFAARGGLRYPQVQQVLKGGQAVTGEIIQAVIACFEEVNPFWLCVGEGAMMRKGEQAFVSSPMADLLAETSGRVHDLLALTRSQQELLQKMQREHKQMFDCILRQREELLRLRAEREA